MNELFALINKYSRLRLHDDFNRHRFMNYFKSITAQYKELGTTFNDVMLIARLMNNLIQEINRGSCMGSFAQQQFCLWIPQFAV